MLFKAGWRSGSGESAGQTSYPGSVASALRPWPPWAHSSKCHRGFRKKMHSKSSVFGSRYRICTWCPLIWRCFCHLGPCGALARCIGMILPMTDWSVTTDPPLGLTPPAQDLQGCPGSSRASTPPGSPPPGHGSGGGQPGSQRVEHRSTPPCGSGS